MYRAKLLSWRNVGCPDELVEVKQTDYRGLEESFLGRERERANNAQNLVESREQKSLVGLVSTFVSMKMGNIHQAAFSTVKKFSLEGISR